MTADAWDALAELVEYPDDACAARADAGIAATASATDVAAALSRFRRAVIAGGTASIQERYIEAFDFDPASTLNMGWHVHGERPEYGVLLAKLRADLARAGVAEHGDLPDHLAALLRLIPRDEEAAASELAAMLTPALASMQQQLAARGNPYTDVIEAARRMVGAVWANEVVP